MPEEGTGVRDGRSQGEGRQGQQLAVPPTPHALHTCSSGAAGAWSTFWNSASRQAVWSCCSRTRARILGRAKLLSICAKQPWTSCLARSSSSSDRAKAAEQSRLGGESRVWPRVRAQCGRAPWPPPRSSPEGPAGSVLSGTVNGAAANSCPWGQRGRTERALC